MALSVLKGANNAGIKRGMAIVSTTSSLNKADVAKKSINVDGNTAPFMLFLEKLTKLRTVTNPVFQHVYKGDLPHQITLSTELAAGAAGVDQTLVVTTPGGDYVNVGDTLLNPRTGEMLRVTVVTSATSINATRGVGSSLGYDAAIPTTDYLMIMGRAPGEGAGAQSGIKGYGTLEANVCQTFEQEVEESRRAMGTAKYGEEDTWEEDKKDGLKAFLEKQERAHLFSTAYSATATSTVGTVMKGMVGYIETNVHSVGGALTEPNLDAYLMADLRRNYIAGRIIFFAGELFIKALNGFARDSVMYTEDTKILGVEAGSWQSNFGEISVVRHGLFTAAGSSVTAANYGWQGCAMMINLDNVNKVVFTNGQRKFLDNLQYGGQDKRLGMWREDCSLEIVNELTHAFYRGITG